MCTGQPSSPVLSDVENVAHTATTQRQRKILPLKSACSAADKVEKPAWETEPMVQPSQELIEKGDQIPTPRINDEQNDGNMALLPKPLPKTPNRLVRDATKVGSNESSPGIADDSALRPEIPPATNDVQKAGFTTTKPAEEAANTQVPNFTDASTAQKHTTAPPAPRRSARLQEKLAKQGKANGMTDLHKILQPAKVSKKRKGAPTTRHRKGR